MKNKNKKEDASLQLASSDNLKKEKKIILRKCLACGKILPREKFLRILKCHKTKEIIISPSNIDFGRSAYVCYNKDCIKVLIKKKKLQKTFKMSISEDFILKLESVLN